MTENRGPLDNLPLPPGQLAGAIAGILASRWLEVPLTGPRRLQRAAGFGLMESIFGRWLSAAAARLATLNWNDQQRW